MNLSRATQLYGQACDAQVGVGCYHLAKLYQSGKGVPANAARAGELFDQACNTGHGKSCSILARQYMTGEGVSKDDKKAAGLYEKGCGGGDADACAKAGGMYESGKGVDKDGGRAVGLYQAACGMESGMGCFALAVAYEHGRGTDTNMKAAVKAYKDACRYGADQACELGGKIVFKSGFEDVWNARFSSEICQVWSFDPEKPTKTKLVADVRGDQFVIMDGPLKDQTPKVTHIGNDFKTGTIYKGLTRWKAPGAKGSDLKFEHFEQWNSAEDPIDAFPGDYSYSQDRTGETLLMMSRSEGEIRRNKPSTACKFGKKGYPMLTTEHCSEIQGLIAAQLLSDCRGD